MHFLPWCGISRPTVVTSRTQPGGGDAGDGDTMGQRCGLRGQWTHGAGRASLRMVPEEACAEGRSQIETWVGSMVWSTTASSSADSVSRSSSARSRALKASMVLAASYRCRLNRRSTTAWMRRRAGWNSAATARVAPATQLGVSAPSPPNTCPSTRTRPA
jgi:hypothetical protein